MLIIVPFGPDACSRRCSRRLLLRSLQRAVGAAAARLIYRRRSADGGAAELAGDEDAVDVLVEQMRRLQQRLLPEERAAHREAVARREADLALDARRKSELILK